MRIGSIEILVLSDGESVVPGDFFGATDGHHADAVGEDGRIRLPIAAFLLRISGKTVLLDAGMGPVHIEWTLPTGGELSLHGGGLPAALAAHGVRPDDIDYVVPTHLHADHAGWLFDDDGKPYVFVYRNYYFAFGKRVRTGDEIIEAAEKLVKRLPEGRYRVVTSNYPDIYVPVCKKWLVDLMQRWFEEYGVSATGFEQTLIGFRWVGNDYKQSDLALTRADQVRENFRQKEISANATKKPSFVNASLKENAND